MARFASITIRAKVIAVIAAMLCCLAVLSLVAPNRLNAVRAAASDVQDNQLPSVLLLGDMAHQTTRFRELEANLVLIRDREARGNNLTAMAAARAQAEARFKAYDPLAGAGAERRMADETWRRWQDYLALHDRLMTGRGDDAALASFYGGEMLVAFDRFQDALKPLIDFNVGEANDGAERGAEVARSARAWILGLIGIMVLLSIGMAWLLVSGVSMPISTMTEAMRRLARREMTVEIPGLARRDEVGAMAGAVQVFRDGMIEADRLNAERELAREREVRRLQQFADATFEGIIIFKRDGTFLHANTAFCKLVGQSDADALHGHSVLEFVAPASLETAKERLRRADEEAVGELQILGVGGHALPAEVLARNFDYDGTEVRLVAVRDLSERKRAEAEIQRLAFHDALTGLPNRCLLNDRLTRALELSARGGSRVAVLCLDLDRFKFVNDLLGHDAGDKLLVEVAKRLGTVVRASDTVARVGGDEFVVVQTLAEQPQSAAMLARRLIESLSAPYDIEGQQVEIGASIGIATHPDDGETTTALLKSGDLALYRAKGSGRGQYQFFAPEMDLKLRERRELEQDLRLAFSRRELELHYQPLFDCSNNTLQGFEALLRWTHPSRGAVPPAEFIPIAEECGLIAPLGRWVLEAACAEAAGWQGSWSVAVNLSSVQFREPGLSDLISEALARTGLAPGRLELEVTESVLIDNPDLALATLTRLRALGVRISLDDFGTGYSSLNYLRRFPFDKLKIDRSFIHDCDTDADARGIVAAIVTLSQCLHIGVVAEGVESEAQLRVLAEYQCHQAQGYLLGRPQPANRLARFMRPDAAGANTAGTEAVGLAAD